MLWIKAFHVIFMVTWFAGLFYLPRLFVYHAQSVDEVSRERFKIMERKLYYGIMMPGAFLTIVLGVILLWMYGWSLYKTSLWLHLKLGLVILLVIFHWYCGYCRKQFYLGKNKHGPTFYKILNEIPVVFLIAIIILVIVKPF